MDNEPTDRAADSNTTVPFEQWAIVELMGHNKIAGRAEEVTIAGKGMLRVDVPAVEEMPAFTKFFSPAAIYAITPTTEDVARYAASRIRSRPVDVYIVPDPSRQLSLHDDADDF